jgi:Leucine-rich repeat (LRR) protein/GTPase SAR1 family protein
MNDAELLAIVAQAEREGWTELDLSGNNLEGLPSAIGRLQSLEKLVLGKWDDKEGTKGNRLTAIPQEIFQLTNLKELHISYNQITAIPDEIAQLANLTTLDLSSNQITAIPDEIAQLANLTTLDLSSNQITAIPDEIAQLANLSQLYLSDNQITQIPDAIANLANLSQLYLSFNQITQIPDAITNLANLTELYLSSNQITQIPDAIANLANLSQLYLSSNQITQIPDVITNLSNLTELSLYSNQITAIPDAIANLSNLTSLDLSSNQITAIPDAIANLSNLTSLYLQRNQITAIPDAIANLSNLTSLDLSSNQITAIPDAIANLSNLTSLDLSSNQITAIPDAIANLSNLTSLSLYNNQITAIPDSIANLSNLTSLDLDNNQITAIPDVIGQLSNLTSLNLYSNQITAIPDAIANLSNLTSLCLYSNQITVIPDAIAQLSNLTSLNLYSNQITAIPDAIAQLSNLTELYLSINQITVIPDAIAQLSNLTELYLDNNQITAIPDAIAQLSNLNSLYLSINQITAIPDAIAQLSNLNSLYLSINQITAIPDAIAQLSNLTELYLDNNQITAIPDAIANLSNLNSLSLRSNQITQVPDIKLVNLKKLDLWGNQIDQIPSIIINFTNLSELDLENNKVTYISEAIRLLNHLDKLDLRGNPISVPPDILGSKRDDDFPEARPILDYYFRIQDPNQTTNIYEAKILIVGEGGSGKTSLANKLIDADYQLKPEAEDISTQGIDILQWEFTGRNQQTYKVNIWDFGGQEIYHQTHQFFLTERSLYLLVADSRKEDTDHYFWLQVIRLLGKDSPILLIQNEKQNRTCNLNLRELRAEFEHLRTPQSINLADNRGLADIKESIQHNLEDLLPKGVAFPNSWLNVRYALENDGRNYISFSEYESICRLHKISDFQEMLDISDFLHRLGICLHFQKDPILRHRLILKPNWGNAAIYKILDNEKVKKELGQFCDSDLDNIWRESQYNNMRHELLQLMKEFKVCYEIPHHRGNYIAPHLLQKDPPNYNWDTSQNLILRYRYKIFMPKGILSRFIVEMHQNIENVSDPNLALVWKYGIVLNQGNTRAEVTERTHDREIRIRLSGSGQKEFLNIINHEFKKIHDRFENRLEYDTLIPCNCDKCKTLIEPYTYTLKRLNQYSEQRRPTIECYESGEDVNVRRLLDDSIDPYRDRKPRDIGDDISSIEDRRSRNEKTESRGDIIYNFYEQTGQVITGNVKPAGNNIGTQNNNLSQNPTPEASPPNKNNSATKPMKTILMLAANPQNSVSLRLQQEERDIKERLRLAGYGTEPIKTAVAVRPRDIQQAMLDFKPQIIHFSGHGANEDGLVFEDIDGQFKLIGGEDLADLFDLFSDRIECVVLNACYSETQAEAIRQKIQYVIGMNQAIQDRSAIEFAVGFYAAIGAGESYEFAFKLGCNAIRLAGIKEYTTPQLLKK